MYLEISPPKTGKTSRLLERLGVFLQTTHPRTMAFVISNKDKSFFVNHVNFNPRIDTSRVIFCNDVGSIPSKLVQRGRFFYDEFDELPSISINLESFYSTSLHKPRNENHCLAWQNGTISDYLLCLVALSGGEFYHHREYGGIGGKPKTVKSRFLDSKINSIFIEEYPTPTPFVIPSIQP